MAANGAIAIIVGYLLGSIPTAYIAARVAKREDVRQIGSGNVGGLNIYRQVGLMPAVIVIIVDIGKGTAAVAIAHYLLHLPMELVLATALAAIVGHMWMVFIKFSGGKAIGVLVGVLCFLLPAYGYWPGMVIFAGTIGIILWITHNVALSTGVALVTLPFIGWLGMESLQFVIWSIIIGILMALKYLPSARESWARTGSLRGFIFDRGRRTR